MPHFEFGSHLLEHLLLRAGIILSMKIKDFNKDDVPKLSESLNSASDFLKTEAKCGIIVQKVETIPSAEEGERKEFATYIEFHPYLFQQYENRSFLKFEDFKTACDQFFSQIESQKIEMKTVQQEKAALKKLDNVKKDHENRIKSLQELQAIDRRKAELIEMNCEIVNNGIKVINSAIANQIPWDQIKEIIKEATEKGDPVASRIKQLKFDVNHIVMLLTDPYAHLDQEYEEEMEDEEEGKGEETETSIELMIEIDLNITAQANARKYFVQKKTAAVKEKKTVESGSVALKSAEKKTKQQLKEMSKIATINKARKVFWFEKFFWFISSENYLVIGGKDAQQNELLVKRYMKPNDVYVHADLHGAATVIVKNPGTSQVPPKTLTEAGQFAVCFSAAWDSKVMTAAYWVKPDQVSKTAPSGEYLTVGSFMVRGKKNFLPPATLIMGFGFLFKLEDSSIERHRGERKVRGIEEESIASDVETVADGLEDVEINIEEGDSEDESDQVKETHEKMDPIEEETICDTSLATVKEDIPDSDSESNSDIVEKDEKEIEEEEKNEAISEFPDTDVIIGLDRLGSVEIKVKAEHEASKTIELAKEKGNNKKVKGKFSSTQGTRGKNHQNNKQNDVVDEGKKSDNIRGKKGKLKKIKEKYKDQDEEERELRMQLLQSQGKGKENKNKKQNKKGLEQLYGKPKEKRPPPKPRVENQEYQNQNEEEKVAVNDETDMLDSLTGTPHEDDELLFVVPVCAPYSNLTNYKYKVKLTPGI